MELRSEKYISRLDYFAELLRTLLQIVDAGATGRLSLRNTERVGLVHLYFQHARLVYVTGDRSDGERVLNDLLTWSKGLVRFDTNALVHYKDLSWQESELFVRWLSLVEMHGTVHGLSSEHVKGLIKQLTMHLPRKPIVLPLDAQEYSSRHMTAHTLSVPVVDDEQRSSKAPESAVREAQKSADHPGAASLFQHMGEMIQQVGRMAHEMTTRMIGLKTEGSVNNLALTSQSARETALCTHEVLSEKCGRG